MIKLRLLSVGAWDGDVVMGLKVGVEVGSLVVGNWMGRPVGA